MPRWGIRPVRDENSKQYSGGIELATVRKETGGFDNKRIAQSRPTVFLFRPSQCVTTFYTLEIR